MALDELKGDDWMVRQQVQQDLLVARSVVMRLKCGQYGEGDLAAFLDFIVRAVEHAAELFAEDIAFHEGQGLYTLLPESGG